MGEQPGIDAHESLDEGIQGRVPELDAVEIVAVDSEGDAGRVVYLVGDAPVTGGLDVLDGVVGCGGIETVAADELHEIELIDGSGPVLVGDVEELVHLLVDVRDVVQAREGGLIDGFEPLEVRLVPQQHRP